jgi:hypothetical protein
MKLERSKNPPLTYLADDTLFSDVVIFLLEVWHIFGLLIASLAGHDDSVLKRVFISKCNSTGVPHVVRTTRQLVCEMSVIIVLFICPI